MKKKLLFLFAFFTIGLTLNAQTIVDLTQSADSSYALHDTIRYLNNGSDVILARGKTYMLGSMKIDKPNSFRVRSEEGTGDPATISITNNLWTNLVDKVDSIVFKDLIITGTPTAYVFNNKNPYVIGKLAFQDCHIESLRGIFRGRWGGGADSANINSFIIDNCVVDSILEYSVLQMTSGNFVDQIKITNSTFYQVESFIKVAESLTSVELKNLSINETALTGGYLGTLLDFKGSPGKLTIENVILGSGLDGPITSLVYTGTPTIQVTNSYYTSSYADTSANQIPDLMAYSGSTTDLWKDPADANFRIIDNGFAGKFTAGDPRWTPARLSSLMIEPGQIDFDPSKLTYSVVLPVNTQAVIVEAESDYEGATVAGGGVIDVSSGTGTAMIIVQEGSISQSYQISFTVSSVGINQKDVEKVKMFFDAYNQKIVIDNSAITQNIEQISIYTLTGRLAKNIAAFSNERTVNIDASMLNNGMYILKASYSDNKVRYLKFIK